MKRTLTALALAGAGAAGVLTAAAPAAANASYTWRLDIRTGDREHAGTSARVEIRLYGTKGQTSAIRLDNPGHNDFERGRVDRFDVDTPVDIGTLTKVRIWHDNSGEKPGWFLDEIRVARKKPSDTNPVELGFFKWLARGEGENTLCYEQKTTSGEPKACGN
ncbi:hypothetical protein GCM10010123_40790 [Pilimelia anulata]|uniref:PLAT domain-containing protein n=1 Tax=Pilimelia anulata TaxID=53371 RepID=A0A8J3FBZ7_9ACTN|nr:PLAT/LH2 domain-containing protein [Pilimelia anulata]GGK06879.1 hypothetical protein GCM10010123_40790 [Pilimelia anulata]